MKPSLMKKKSKCGAKGKQGHVCKYEEGHSDPHCCACGFRWPNLSLCGDVKTWLLRDLKRSFKRTDIEIARDNA